MLRVTRNALVLVVGLTLFGDASVDADSDYYRVDVDRQHTRWFPGTGYSSSRYDIRIERPYSSTRKICNGSCINNPTISCAGGEHFVSVPGILNYVTQKRRMNRNLRAQTELLEAQTALLNYQLQQQQRAERNARRLARQANRRPRQRVVSDEDRRLAQKRLVKRYTQQHQSTKATKAKYRNEFDVMVEVVRLGVLDAKTAISRYAKHRPPQSVARLRDALEKANLLKPPQPHSDFIHHTNTTDITLP